MNLQMLRKYSRAVFLAIGILSLNSHILWRNFLCHAKENKQFVFLLGQNMEQRITYRNISSMNFWILLFGDMNMSVLLIRYGPCLVKHSMFHSPVLV